MKTTLRTALIAMMLCLLSFCLPAAADEAAQAGHPSVISGTFAFSGMYNSEEDYSLRYVYSDSYFGQDASVYNPSLATMSLCFEVSTWSSKDSEIWAEKSKNAQDLLVQLGFSDYAQNAFWDEAPTKESIGAVAAHKQLGDATLIALGVRGGGYFSEWGSNVTVGGSDAHTGFAQARDNVLAFLREYIAEHGITGRVKLWLVGFSRAGAVANMTAGYLNANPLDEGVTLDKADLYCYTFEAPQGATEALAGSDSDDSNIHNVLSANDLVPLVAPRGWGFQRYNAGAHLLPTITTASFDEAKAAMLEQYAILLEEVGAADAPNAVYNISEYAKTLNLRVNWQSILPGGDAFMEVEVLDDMHLPQSIMLNNFVDAFARAMPNREGYHDNAEADMAMLLADLLGASDSENLSNYIAALGEAFTVDGFSNLLYVIAPVFDISMTPLSERVDQVAARLADVVPQPEGYTDLYGSISLVSKTLARLIVNNPDEVLDLVLSLANTAMLQPHYPEIVFAWLRSEDPNFASEPYCTTVPETLRIVRINCPVNIEVYDAQGNLVGSLISGEAFSSSETVGCAVNEDGEKLVYLPSDAGYTIRITATGEGTMDVALNELNIVRGGYTRALIYPDNLLESGKSFTLEIPALAETEMADEAKRGSDADYRLLAADGSDIPAGSSLRGSEVKTCTVSAQRESADGQVRGGGQYVVGSYAQVSAYPAAGGSFLGWYNGGELVSSDEQYRFLVTQDVTLTAHFKSVKPYTLTIRTGEGGTVTHGGGTYTPGTTVAFSAIANDGYVFDRWIGNGALVSGSGEATGSVLMPRRDVTVRAQFLPVCAHCGETYTQAQENRHTLCRICGRHWCDTSGGRHVSYCGDSSHRACTDGYNRNEHRKCDNCSGYVCDGSNHRTCGRSEETVTVTAAPTPAPTPAPAPTEAPSEAPAPAPTEAPSEAPSEAPTEAPSEAPSTETTEAPSEAPSDSPSAETTPAPSEDPSADVSAAPSESPTA